MIFTVSGWGALHSFDRINPDKTHNIQGNYAIAGNTVMCLTEKTTGYGGTCQDTGYELITSNMHVSKYIDIDGNTGTWNSTSSYITIPPSFDYDTSNPNNPKKGVLWAGLFWQGRISANTGNPLHYGKENGINNYNLIDSRGDTITDTYLKTAGAKQIKLKIDNGAYNDINSSTFYTYGGTGGKTYACFADVTSSVKTAIDTDGNHTFTVANLTTNEGRESSPGVFGGWSLVVIYAEDNTGDMRNISVFNGFDIVKNPSNAFTIADFILPKSNTVKATLSLFSGEGEYRYGHRPGNTGAYDWVKMSPDNVNYDFMPVPAGLDDRNIFDARFSGVTRVDINGESNDLQVNNDGVDIDNYDVSALMTTYRDNNPNMNSMYIQWSSNNDYITPSMLVFATQIYAPKMCYDYSLKQDNHFLTVDRASDPVARIDSRISSSDIGIMIYIKNTEADIPAKGISFRSDVNATMFDQTGHTYSSNVNGSILQDRGIPTLTTPLCDYNASVDNNSSNNGCTDGHNVRKGLGDLDAQQYIYAKFLLSPNISGVTDINESLGLTMDYYISVNGAKITYNDYQLGGKNVPLCPPTGGYNPTFGLFNVVQSGLTTNNLNTQISRKTFNADVIFDSDVATGTNDAPSSDINTTVMVEIIDMDSFGDINASCANPDSSVSDAIFVPVSFTASNWQTQIPTQVDNYYNFAVRNAAFRIWYFTDSNGSLIQNWSATTTNGNKDLISISGLYNSVTFPLCSTACSSPTSTTCFSCIRENYARPLCSRDNFSVRPESFDIHLIDANQTSTPTSMNDLSTLYNYSPDASSPPTDRIHIVGDYNYRFDVNSTGHNSLAFTPGYTRNFNNDSDHNATVLWDSNKTLTVCNNISDIPLSFYMINGILTNGVISNPNVGEYKINIIDTSWTAVDWDSAELAHHSTAGFLSGTDCIIGSDSSSLNGSQYGCTITSNHLNTYNGNIYTYRDIAVEFHPYAFTIANTVTFGRGNSGTGVLSSAMQEPAKPFVYMNNLSDDENMSVHLNTTVTARGKNSATALSNFVKGCFEKPVHLDITRTATTNTALAYSYITHNKDINGSVISADDINRTIAAGTALQSPSFSTSGSFFQKDQNGTMQLLTNSNYNREVNVTTNPEDINFTTISVDDNATLFNADLLTNKYAEGNLSVNQRVLYYYGRTVAPKIRVTCNTKPCRTGMHASNNNNIKELISYVIFCQGGTCNSSILPTGATQVADIRWFENRNHDFNLPLGTDGTIGTISEVATPSYVSEISRSITKPNYETEAVMELSNTAALPYDAIMQMQSSPWLIYNANDANATANQFIIEFVGEGGWSGKYEDNTTTKTNESGITNRRIMW